MIYFCLCSFFEFYLLYILILEEMYEKLSFGFCLQCQIFSFWYLKFIEENLCYADIQTFYESKIYKNYDGEDKSKLH